MKIFLGCEDTASVLSGLAEGFRQIGHDAVTTVFSKNKFYPTVQYDNVLLSSMERKWRLSSLNLPQPMQQMIRKIDDSLLKQHLLKKTNTWISQFDLFVFVWRPWLPEGMLFPKIKAAGKKIICVHLGSDVRHISAYKQEFREDVALWEKFFHDEDVNEKIERIRLHETFADAIFSVPDQESLAIRGYNHIFLPIGRKKNLLFNVPGREVPKIIHAPSRSGIKGTSLIIRALQQLKESGHRFEFELVQGVENDELLSRLSDADILVDELLLHGPGVLSTEAMLCGCAVATRTLPSYKHIFDPPVLSITPDSIQNQMKLLLENKPLRIQLALKGRDFSQKYNDPRNIAQQMIESLNKVEYDYQSNFYIEKYVLPESVKLTRKNKQMSAEIASRYYQGTMDNILRAKNENLIS